MLELLLTFAAIPHMWCNHLHVCWAHVCVESQGCAFLLGWSHDHDINTAQDVYICMLVSKQLEILQSKLTLNIKGTDNEHLPTH